MKEIFYFLFLSNSIAALAQLDSKLDSIAKVNAQLETPGNLISYYGVTPGPDEKTYSITITVKGIRNNKGTIRFKFYDDVTGFPHAKGFLRIVVPKSEVIDGTMTKTYYGFKGQSMGIALLDDENDDLKLEMGWFFPKEGHAFSDYYHSALRKPRLWGFQIFTGG
ncbi:MAG: DUF2141 domain-containing protein [Bacteroidota bacterium]